MDAYNDAVRKYRGYLSAVQKKTLKKKARALSLANAQQRMELVEKDRARITETNTLLTDYGLATSLYAAPVSGEDAASRRMSTTGTGERVLAAGEAYGLMSAAKRMKEDTVRAREEAEKKRKRSGRTQPGGTEPETGLPGRTVTVRKL